MNFFYFNSNSIDSILTQVLEKFQVINIEGLQNSHCKTFCQKNSDFDFKMIVASKKMMVYLISSHFLTIKNPDFFLNFQP